MNNYRRRTYSRKRSYSGRHRRTQEPYHQPLPSDQSTIPNTRHTLTKPDVEAVVDALLSGTLTRGGERERFESLLAKLTHSRFAISMSSGTAAIHAVLARLDLAPDDEVITSTMNHCAVANMVHVVGAKLVLVDCDPDTLTINVDATREAITSQTKVIFGNNFGGHPSDMAVLRELCVEHSIHLLEDAGHGLGGKYRGHYVGNQADLTCFSFNPSMAITTCEGGAVTTDDPEDARWLRMFRDLGRQKAAGTSHATSDKPSSGEEVMIPGFNFNMSELHAALGRSQLTRLERHIERRRVIANYYHQKLSHSSDLILPFVADWAQHSYHAYPVQLSGQLFGKRDEIFNALKAEGLGLRIHFLPIHRMPFFQERVGDPSQFPNAEAYYHNCLSLPIFPDLSIKDLERITDLVLKTVGKFIKARPEPVAINDQPAEHREKAEQEPPSDERNEDREEKTSKEENASADTEASKVDERPAREKKTRRRRPPSRKSSAKKAANDDTANVDEQSDKDDATPEDEEITRLQKSAGRLRIIPKESDEDMTEPAADKPSESKPDAGKAKTTRSPKKKAAKTKTPTEKESPKTKAESASKPKRTRKTPARKPKSTKSAKTKTDAKADSEDAAQKQPTRTQDSSQEAHKEPSD